MKLKLFLASLFVLLSLVSYKTYNETKALKSIDSYESCIGAKGSLIQESYPATCVTRLGSRFIQPTTLKIVEPSPEAIIKPIRDFSKDYSFTLPSGWYQRDRNMFLNYTPSEIDTNFKQPKDKGKLKIEVNILRDAISLNDGVNSTKIYPDEKYQESQIIVDNQPAILVESPSRSSTAVVKNPHTNDIYLIHFFLDFYNFKPLRDQILSTFKFTN